MSETGTLPEFYGLDGLLLPTRDDKRREMCNEWERIEHITSLDSSIVGVWEGERVHNTFYPYRALSTADMYNKSRIHSC